MKTKQNRNSKSNSNPLLQVIIVYSKSFALIGLIIFLLLSISSIYFYPKYDFSNQYLSDLGVGSTSLLFNSGIIIASILLLPFIFSLYKSYSFLSQTTYFLGFASVIFFAGIAVFPLTFQSIHSFIAGLFFFSMSFFILFALLLRLKNWLKIEPKPILVESIFLLLSTFTILITFIFLFISFTPLMQKLSILSIVLWVFLFIFLHKR
ncbi:MAG: DUF998 domain-containing protein [archaeon]